LKKISDFSLRIQFNTTANTGGQSTGFGPFKPVLDAVSNDLNTADALGKLFGLIRELSDAWERGDFEKDVQAKETLHNGFRAVLDLFGFSLIQEKQDVVPDEILALAEERWQAKLSKDWAAADLLRGKIEQTGWAVKDSKDSYMLSKS